MQNHEQGIKRSVENNVLVEKIESHAGKSHVLRLTFFSTPGSGQLYLSFDSFTKMDHWHKALTSMKAILCIL